MSAKPLWQLTDVQVRRGSHVWPEKPLTLSIGQGTTAVLGLSGAGKTSLLDLLVDFVQPSGGSIRGLDGGSAAIAWVPQNHALWTGHSVLEHLTLVGAAESEAVRLLERFDLGDKKKNRADTLSLGESARLAVARALAQRAAVVVMDEPLAHVDSARVRKYWRVIRENIAERGASFIVATHQPEIALAEAANAVCLRDGSVIFQGTMAALYHEPPTEELASYLGAANWFDETEAHNWIAAAFERPRCIRSERLIINIDPNGTFITRASRFLGSHAETELQDAAGKTRVFYHRPVAAIPTGARVRIQLLPNE